jgi:hypothetical protein
VGQIRVQNAGARHLKGYKVYFQKKLDAITGADEGDDKPLITKSLRGKNSKKSKKSKTTKKSQKGKITLKSEKDSKEVEAKYKAKMPEIKEALSEEDKIEVNHEKHVKKELKIIQKHSLFSQIVIRTDRYFKFDGLKNMEL